MTERRNGVKKNAVVDLIEQGVSGILGTQNVLARLWRIILNKYMLSGRQWQQQVTQYQEKVARSTTKKGGANIKGNLTRSLAKDAISWKTFLAGLSIIQFDKIRIEVHLTKKGKTEVIGLDINNDEEMHCPEPDDDD